MISESLYILHTLALTSKTGVEVEHFAVEDLLMFLMAQNLRVED